jgi:Zincin-like metallopeptidase
MTWRPYLPEPRPAYRLNPSDPEPVPLEVLRYARSLCATFRVPPRQFRQRVRKGEAGYYNPASDIVAVDPDRAAMDGLGGEDGYYALLLHELLHATGHTSRLDRATSGDYSPTGYELEEGTVRWALRIVLERIGFPPEALDWHAPGDIGLPVDRTAAHAAAEWLLQSRTHCGSQAMPEVQQDPMQALPETPGSGESLNSSSRARARVIERCEEGIPTPADEFVGSGPRGGT